MTQINEDVLKGIFSFLEPNTRYIIAARCPTLRPIHKSLPIHIDHLKLSPSSFSINGSIHAFHSMIQESEEQKLPRHLQEINDNYGVPYDLTSTGKRDDEADLLFQDVQVGGIRFAQNFIDQFNVNSGSLEGQMTEFIRVAASMRGGRDPVVQCTPYIEYTLSRNHQMSAVTYPPGNRIRHAIRRHLGNVLGNGEVSVRLLEIGCQDGVLRFPGDVKFRVQEIKLRRNGNAVLHAIRPVISECSFPLQKISILVQEAGDPVFQNQVVQASGAVDIRIDYDPDGNWAEALKKLPNKIVHLAVGEIPIEQLGELAFGWMENPRVVGSKFSMPSRDVATILERAAEVLPVCNATIESRRCDEFPVGASIQISEDLEINIYGAMAPNHEKELLKPNGKPWMIVMESMAFGSAAPCG
ncbi:unnamed protein product [Caenorhabditis nigoni]